jgi:hypothetical protein
VALGDLSQGHPTTTITDDLLPIDIQPSPTDPLPFELGPSHSGPNSFYDQTSFEFADSTNDDDHGATQWAGGIDVFSKTDEIDVQMIEVIEHFQEVPNRASHAVERPNHDYIEAMSPGVRHKPIQTGAFGLCSADRVGVLADNLVAACLRQGAQVAKLGLGVLIATGNSGIEHDSLH